MDAIHLLFEDADELEIARLTDKITAFYDAQKTSAHNAADRVCRRFDESITDAHTAAEALGVTIKRFAALKAAGRQTDLAYTLFELEGRIKTAKAQLVDIQASTAEATTRLTALGHVETLAKEVATMSDDLAKKKTDLGAEWSATVATEFGKIDKLIRSRLDDAAATLPTPNKCVVCRVAETTHMILPCNHAMYCKTCVDQIRERCAVCNQTKRSAVRVYM